MKISDQLAVISRWNPGIDLSDDDVRKVNDGVLVLVGHGSILAPGTGVGTGSGDLTQKGCIEYMRYQEGSKDLQQIRIDGTWYSPTNLGEFREILEKAAFHMKCVNFCYYTDTRRMTMLNVYPQCCCRCEEIKT